jgi:hypothetical protein
VRTLDGHAIALKQGTPRRPTVFVFLSPWCESYLATTRPSVSADCRAAREQVTALARTSKVRWLGVASGLWATSDDLREYRTKYRVTIPMTLDGSGTLFRQFGVKDTPTIVVADADDHVVRRIEAAQLNSLAGVVEGL